MSKLPTELFTHVVSYLPKSEKLKRIRVSKKWHDIITTNSLYNKVDFNTDEKFEQGLDYFYKNPHIGKSVHHLSIGALKMDVERMISIPLAFPKVQSVDWIEVGSTSDESDDDDTNEEMVVFGNEADISSMETVLKKQWSQLEKVVSLTSLDSFFAKHLLSSSVYASLI